MDRVQGEKITKVGGEILNREKEVVGKFSAQFKILVLAAGAIQTPYLLLKNGVANSSGMVGKNLRIHPCVNVIGVFEEVLNGWDGVSQSLAVNEFAKEGIILETTFVPPSLLLASNWLAGEDLSELLLSYRNASMVGIMISEDDSKGKVLTLPDFLPIMGKTPLVQYKFGAKDVQKALKVFSKLAGYTLHQELRGLLYLFLIPLL